MSFLSRMFGEKGSRRVFVLGLDGVPHSFLLRAFEEGLLPNLRELAAGGRMARMTSVIPTVSSVAWSTYMTGRNPGGHRIYGFVDRQAGSYDVFVPTSVNMSAPTLWEVLGKAGRKVVVVNVPVTYPPGPVNGVLVSDFLCTRMDKVAWPPEVSAWLKEYGYRIDADAKLARSDLAKFAEDVRVTLEKRFGAAFHLMEEYPWDFFQLHVMETDRVNHFLWPGGEEDPARPMFEDFYRRLDAFVGETERRLPPDVLLVLMSDHGFCPVVREVYLNQFLVDGGFLALPPGQGPAQLLAESRAYSLIPGRVYVNLEGREPRGSVKVPDYRKVREEVSAALLGLVDPESGRRVIREVIPGEQLYRGEGIGAFPAGVGGSPSPYPPDMVAVPEDGYDLKGNVGKGVFGRTELVGMHTFDDAFLMVRGEGTPLEGVPGIADVMPSILEWMGVDRPAGLDGRPLRF